MKPVFVNGANGHLGWFIVKELLKRGYPVRASVTDASDRKKTTLLETTSADIVESSLTDRKSLEKAISGCSGVFHVAAPYLVDAKNRNQTIYNATIEGTRNILETALSEKAGKLIYTSSVGCVGSSTDQAVKDEKDWVDHPSLLYVKAKTDAERLFQDFIKRTGLNGSAALPSTMIGPEFTKTNPSTALFVKLIQGKLPAILPIHLDFVDVRDVAKAHVDLFEKNEISKRYILSGYGMDLKNVILLIKKIFPEQKVPSMVLPLSLLPAAVLSDWLEAAFTGGKRLVTKEILDEFGGKKQLFSSEKAKKEIGWNPRPLEDSLRDTVLWIKNHYLQAKKSDREPEAYLRNLQNAI